MTVKNVGKLKSLIHADSYSLHARTHEPVSWVHRQFLSSIVLFGKALKKAKILTILLLQWLEYPTGVQKVGCYSCTLREASRSADYFYLIELQILMLLRLLTSNHVKYCESKFSRLQIINNRLNEPSGSRF